MFVCAVESPQSIWFIGARHTKLYVGVSTLDIRKKLSVFDRKLFLLHIIIR